jgi:exosortase
MLIGWAAYSLGDSYYIQVAWHGGAVILAIGALFSILGTQVLFAFLPAVFVLLFMIPVPGRVRQRIAIPLERVTTQVTQEVCETVGMDVHRTGNVLEVNNRQVEIAEACNGLRMVFALTLVSFAVGFGTPLRWYVRVLIVVGSPISAIVCNVIRLVPTVWFYGYTPANVASSFHDISGWLMLPVAFLLLMGLVKLLQWALVPVNTYTLAYD